MLARSHFEGKVIFPTTLIGMTDKTYQPTIAGLRAFVAVAEKQHFGSAATSSRRQPVDAVAGVVGSGDGSGRAADRTVHPPGLPHDGGHAPAAAGAGGDRSARRHSPAAAAGSSDPLQGTIRLGLIPTVAPYVLPTLLAGLADRLPALDLRLIEDQTERLLTGLREGSVDAALIALPAESQPASPKSRSTTRISYSRCRPGIRWQASDACRRPRSRSCRCCF